MTADVCIERALRTAFNENDPGLVGRVIEILRDKLGIPEGVWYRTAQMANPRITRAEWESWLARARNVN